MLVDCDKEQCSIADKYEQGRESEQDESPPTAFDFPTYGLPCTKDKGEADEGNNQAHGLEVVGAPNVEEVLDGAVDRKQAHCGAETSKRDRNAGAQRVFCWAQHKPQFTRAGEATGNFY